MDQQRILGLVPVTEVVAEELLGLAEGPPVQTKVIMLHQGGARSKKHAWIRECVRPVPALEAFVDSAALIRLINEGQSPTKDMEEILKPTIVVEVRVVQGATSGILYINLMDKDDFTAIEDAYVAACQDADAAVEAMKRSSQNAKAEPEMCGLIASRVKEFCNITLEALKATRAACKARDVGDVLRTAKILKIASSDAVQAALYSSNIARTLKAYRYAARIGPGRPETLSVSPLNPKDLDSNDLNSVDWVD